MAKNIFLLIVSIVMGLSSLTAGKLTPDQALSRLQPDMPIPAGRAGNLEQPRLVDNISDGSIYVFETGDTPGYMLVSGDDCVAPLLGYSVTGNFNRASMPQAMKWLIEEYVRQIEYADANNMAYSGRSHNPDVVEPLIKTRWDQATPYNNLCPSDRNGVCYTGCVATAMAQVMNYWKYPSVGKGTHSFTPTSLNTKLSIDFSEREFDWEAMPDVYNEGNYSEREADAVAWLMKACGHAVDMKYSSQSSGALSALVPRAMRDYFSYNPGIWYAERMAYSASEWENLIVDNLKNCGPIIYNGHTQLSGGHTFVCDGYDGNGFFHINWGWSGESDGYFLFDLLDPDNQGIGGSTAGFNFKQSAILGICPPDDTNPAASREPQLTQYGSLTATVTGPRTITFGVENYSPLGWGSSYIDNVSLTLGALLEPQGDTPGENQYITAIDYEIYLSPGEYYSEQALIPKFRMATDLAEGTYRMSLVTRNNRSDTGIWSPMIVPNGYNDFVTLVKDENGLSVINYTDPALSVTQAEIISELAYGEPVTVRATLTNSSSCQLTQGVSIVLLSPTGFRRFVSEGSTVTLAPGETVTKDFTSRLTIMAGAYDPTTDRDFTLALHNPVTNTYYGTFGDVVMLQEAGIDLVSQDASEVTVTFDRAAGSLSIKGIAPGATTTVYAADGKMVAAFKGDSYHAVALQRGVYIVSTLSATGKKVNKKFVL